MYPDRWYATRVLKPLPTVADAPPSDETQRPSYDLFQPQAASAGWPGHPASPARTARQRKSPRTMPVQPTRVFRWHLWASQSTCGRDPYRIAVTRVDTAGKAALPRQSSQACCSLAAPPRNSAGPAPASASVTRRYRTVPSVPQSAHPSANRRPANADPAPYSHWTTRLCAAADCDPARPAGSPAICRVTMTRLNATACRRG